MLYLCNSLTKSKLNKIHEIRSLTPPASAVKTPCISKETQAAHPQDQQPLGWCVGDVAAPAQTAGSIPLFSRTTGRPRERARRKSGAGGTAGVTTTTTTNSDDVGAPSRVSAPSRDRRVLSLRCDGSRRERFLRQPLLEKNSRFSRRLRVRYSRHDDASSKSRRGRPSIPVRERDRSTTGRVTLARARCHGVPVRQHEMRGRLVGEREGHRRCGKACRDTIKFAFSLRIFSSTERSQRISKLYVWKISMELYH